MTQQSPPPANAADAQFFAALPAETRFFLVRHGQSEGNARGIVQGRLDLPLDDAGRAQAAETGSWLAAEGLVEILASPLCRAAETARIIARAACLPDPLFDDRLVEMDTGPFSGLSLEEARRRYSAAYAAFERRSWDGVPGAESSASLYERAMAAWSLARDRALAGSRAIAVVSHGGFIQWLFRATFGCRSWMPLVPTGNCGVFELLVSPCAQDGGCVGDGTAGNGGAGDGAYLQWRRINFQASTLPAVRPVF